MTAAAIPIRRAAQPPTGLDAGRAVAAALDLADAYRQAEIAGLDDIDRDTAFALAERHGGDAVAFALRVMAQRDLAEAAALRRYAEMQEAAP